MKQIIQYLNNGKIEVVNVPKPIINQNQVLVHSLNSLISSGTERMLLEFGKSNLISKALQQPEKTKAVLNKIAKEYSSDAKDKEQIKSKLMLIGSVLGIFQDKSFNQVSDEMQQKIEALIIKRENAKKDNKFDIADQIRNELNELGIEIKDTSEGTSWNLKS